jgi:hypothetical protein
MLGSGNILSFHRQRSQSARNLHEQLYGSLPKSMTSEVFVKSKIEDPDVLAERRRLAQSKSVQELSQIHSLSEFPLPSPLKRMVSRSNKDLSSAPVSGRFVN